MNFSEFLREEEEMGLLDEALMDEGLLDGGLRAVKGAVGNLVGQTARGLDNVVRGTGRALGGAGKVGLGTVQGLSGGGRRAVSNIGSGVADVAGGLGTAVKGAAQTAGAVSGVTPVMRGVQAATEKSLFTPMSSRRTELQRAMGLNSWDPDGDARKDSAGRFEELKRMYARAREAGDGGLKRRIRAEMEKADPVAYRELIRRSNAARAEYDRLRWKGVADQVRDEEPPEDFLGRLSSEN